MGILASPTGTYSPSMNAAPSANLGSVTVYPPSIMAARGGVWWLRASGPFAIFRHSRRHQGQHPNRAAASVHDLQRCRDHHRSGGRNLIQVAEAGQPEL